MTNRGTVRFKPVSGLSAAALLLAVVFFLGGLLGVLAAGRIEGESGLLLGEYLRAWLSGGGQSAPGLWSVLWTCLRFPLAVWLLGFSGAGVGLIPLVFGVRGFLLSFGAACLCRLFGAAGLVPALALFGLPALLWGPALFVLGVLGMDSALSLVRRGSVRFHWRAWTLCLAAVWSCVWLEMLVLPGLMALVSRFVL